MNFESRTPKDRLAPRYVATYAVCRTLAPTGPRLARRPPRVLDVRGLALAPTLTVAVGEIPTRDLLREAVLATFRGPPLLHRDDLVGRLLDALLRQRVLDEHLAPIGLEGRETIVTALTSEPLTADEGPEGVAQPALAPGKIDQLLDERDGPVTFERQIQDLHQRVLRTNLIGLEIREPTIVPDDHPVHRILTVQTKYQKNRLHQPSSTRFLAPARHGHTLEL